MGMIYRTPLLVARKTPFVEWLRSLAKPAGIDDDESARAGNEVDVYLLHSPAHQPALEEMIRRVLAGRFRGAAVRLDHGRVGMAG